jgi:hypothetical protein
MSPNDRYVASGVEAVVVVDGTPTLTSLAVDRLCQHVQGTGVVSAPRERCCEQSISV